MDVIKGKERKGNLIVKTWEKCKSFGHGSDSPSPKLRCCSSSSPTAKNNKSWPRIDDLESGGKSSPRKRQVAPEGCFSVYVGPQKQRFAIKTEYANHPLFKVLLEEAESEYGFKSEGPLELPCNVDVFWKVLLAITDHDIDDEIPQGCGFSLNNYGSYRLLTTSPLVAMNQF